MNVKGSECQLNIPVPVNGSIAPPGNWFLFVLDKDLTPSIASSIRLQKSGSMGKNIVVHSWKNGFHQSLKFNFLWVILLSL